MGHKRLLWLGFSFFLRLNAQVDNPLSELKQTTMNNPTLQPSLQDLPKQKSIVERIAPIHPVCTSSVIWGNSYQNIHNLIIKNRSIRAQHPWLPHFVLVTDDVSQLAINALESEGMIIKHIDHVEYTAENRENGFEKIMTKTRALELSECEWSIQMDTDMIVLGSILEAVAECEIGGNVLCGVPQSPSCHGRECCKPQGNGNTLHVLVINTGFLVYRPGSGLQEKLFDTLKVTKAKREQTLWGQMICYNEELPVLMLSRKYNIWTDLSWVPDIHVLHYGIGPSYLGADMVPLTNDKVYSKHFGFDYYRKLSLGVDSCAEHIIEEECVADPKLQYLPFSQELLPNNEDDGKSTLRPVKGVESSRFLEECVWKANRCISKKLSALQVDDKDEEMGEIISANAALQCIIRDNPEGTLSMIQNCGMFCSYGLHFEDYCDKNFSLFHCVWLMIQYMTDYRAYATLFIGVWVSCLPKTYVWCLRVGFILVSVGFCSLFFFIWKLVTKLLLKICSCCAFAKRRNPRWQRNTKRMMGKQSPMPAINMTLDNLMSFPSRSKQPTIDESQVLLNPSPISESNSFAYESIIPAALIKLTQQLGKRLARKKN